MALSREITAQIKELLEKNPQGLSITSIVSSTRINRNTAGRYLDNLLVSGQVEMRHFGMAKIYSLSQRLPVSSILSISSDFFLQLDSGLRIVYLNTPFEHLLGVAGKELLGKNIEYSAIPQVLDTAFPPLLSRIKEGVAGTDYHGELEVPALNRVFFCRVVPVVFTEGQRGVSVLLEDITSRKQDEERLRRSESRLRCIIEAAPVGIGLVVDRVITEVNDRLSDMTGYRPRELIGRSARILYTTTEDFEYVGKEKYRQIEEMGSGMVETQWRRKDGTIIDILLSSTPLNPQDPEAGITFIALDTTRQKRTETELLEQERQYRFIADNSLDIITRQTPTCVCMYVSPSVTPILGYSVQESVGISVLALVCPEDIIRVQEELHAIGQNGCTNTRSTFRFRHKDGRYLWFESTINVIRDEKTGKIREFLCISRDITARIQSEETARSRDRVLHAFGAASGFLLTGRIRDPFPRVLAIMGEAMDADAVYIYQDFRDPGDGSHFPKRKYRWTKDPARDPGTSMNCRVLFPESWSDRLASGVWIAGPRGRFGISEQEKMDGMGVQSILVVPIQVKGAYWGFIGCSDLHAEHEWADSEIEILMTLAATIGIVLERQAVNGII